jgi:hypothetical protein
MMVLLKKAFVVCLVTAVLTTLWVVGSERSARVPIILKADGTALYRDAVAASDGANQTTATSVVSVVRSLVTG